MYILLLLYLNLPIFATQTYIIKDVFSRNSNSRVTRRWLEGGQVYADDFNWVNVTTALSTFTTPIILLSLPEFGGDTYSSGAALSVRIRNKQVGSSGTTSFQIKANI